MQKQLFLLLFILSPYAMFAQSKTDQIEALRKTRDSLIRANEMRSTEIKTLSIANQRLEDQLEKAKESDRVLMERLNELKENPERLADNELALADIYIIDTTYQHVYIDGVLFSVQVLSDKYNEINEPHQVSMDCSNSAPKSLLVRNVQTGKIAYFRKFDISIPEIYKTNNDLSKPGKLYLSMYSSGCGSGYTLTHYLVSLQDGNITLDEIFQSSELSYTYFSKNDREIYVFNGIWDMGEPGLGDEETHFSDHRYEVYVLRFTDDGFEKKYLGTTKLKYSGEELSKEDLKKMVKSEKFFPSDFDLNDF